MVTRANIEIISKQRLPLFFVILDRSDHFILVAENAAGQLVGYAHACRYDCLYFSSLLNLLALAVAPDFQGQGHGRSLMRVVREEGSAAGYAGIRINSGILSKTGL